MSTGKQDENDHVYDDRHWFESDVEVAPEVIVGAPDEKAVFVGDTAFVPTRVELSPRDEHATLKLVITPDDELVVLAYTSLEHLVRCCGERQPWVAFHTERINALPEVAGADVLLWNQELPPELRRDADGDDPEPGDDGHGSQGRREP